MDSSKILESWADHIVFADAIDALKLLPDECIDLTVTSPPYDNLRDYHGYRFDFENFKKLANELYRVIKKGGVVVWIIGDATIKGSETGSSFKQALYFKEIGFKLHDTMIYEKSAFANPSRNRYHQIFEYMFILSKGSPKTFNPLKDKPNKTQYDFGKKRRKKDGTMTNKNDKSRIKVSPFGMRFNIWRYVTGRGNTTRDAIAFEHPAVFPEKLARDHIKSWSNPGDLILDPMNGSGTTTKMAYLLGRHFIGIDISERYCQIAVQRLKDAKKYVNDKYERWNFLGFGDTLKTNQENRKNKKALIDEQQLNEDLPELFEIEYKILKPKIN